MSHAVVFMEDQIFKEVFIKVFRYPAGQKYSLELLFAKFTTAKIAKDLNPLKYFATGGNCLKSALSSTNILLMWLPEI